MLRIEIDTEHYDGDDEVQADVARILKTLARSVERGWWPTSDGFNLSEMFCGSTDNVTGTVTAK